MKTRTKSPECLDVDGKIITNFSDQNAMIGSEFKLFDFDYWDPKSLILDPVNISKNEDGYYPASVWEMLDFLSKNPIDCPLMANGSLEYYTANLRWKYCWPDGHASTLRSARIAVYCLLHRPKYKTVEQVQYSWLLEGLYEEKSEIMSLGVRRNTDTHLFLHHPTGDIDLDKPGNTIPCIFTN